MKRLLVILTVIGSLTIVLTTSCSNAQEYEFVFDPPVGIEYVQITVSKETLYMNDEAMGTKETHIEVNSIIETLDSNFLITTEPISIEYIVDGETVNEPAFDIMENLVYQLEVDKSGQLLGIYGIEGALDSMYNQYAPEVRELMSQFFNEDVFYAIIFDEWNKSIGNFAGRKFSVGDKWAVIDTMQLLIGPLAYIEKTITFAQILECGNNQCVQIKVEYSAEPEIPEAAFMEFLEGLMNTELEDSLKVELRSLKIHGVGERIIDPATMLIYSKYEKKVSKMEIVSKAEGLISIRKEEIDVDSMEYYFDVE